MRFLRYSYLFLLVVITCLLMSGCKAEYDAEYWNYVHNNNDVIKLRNELADVGKLNSSPDSSFEIEGEYPELYTVLDSNLEKCLGSICENYNLTVTDNEKITEETVKEALGEDIINTANEYKEKGESFYLYKLFAWCGEFCRENVVFCGVPADEQKEVELLNTYKYTNYKIILGQKNATEKNLVYPFKFKWQH